MKARIARLFFGALLALGVSAIEPAAESAGPHTGFFTGTWRGGDGETLIEETWSSDESGQKIGMFRLMIGGKPRFYELMTIEPLDQGWVMYLRHFSPGLKAWEDMEDALVFDLVDVEPNRAVFDQRNAETNLIYERTDDKLTVTLEKFVDGEWDRTVFEFERE